MIHQMMYAFGFNLGDELTPELLYQTAVENGCVYGWAAVEHLKQLADQNPNQNIIADEPHFIVPVDNNGWVSFQFEGSGWLIRGWKWGIPSNLNKSIGASESLLISHFGEIR